MISKKMTGRIFCSAAIGALVMMPLAAKADGSMASSAMTSADAMSTPTAVTGSVVRYYVDRGGYVSAMDIQTANGISMVRFSPGMGQRLYSTYPVGQQATVYVVGSADTDWDVVGMGETAPAPMPRPPFVSDLELLDSQPYVVAGSKMITRNGRLSRLIVNKRGEVVGLVLNDSILVRTPREERNVAPGQNGTDRVAGLFKGANVEVTGYEEAPRYGVISSYSSRIAANALVVNGRAVGAIGIPMLDRRQTKSLLNWNIGGADKTPEEMKAMHRGYSTYSPMTPAP